MRDLIISCVSMRSSTDGNECEQRLREPRSPRIKAPDSEEERWAHFNLAVIKELVLSRTQGLEDQLPESGTFIREELEQTNSKLRSWKTPSSTSVELCRSIGGTDRHHAREIDR